MGLAFLPVDVVRLTFYCVHVSLFGNCSSYSNYLSSNPEKNLLQVFNSANLAVVWVVH